MGPKKIFLLHETDLARISLLSPDEKLIQLRRVRDFIPSMTWNPFRAVLPAIFQSRKSLFELPKVTLEEIEAAILRSCKKHPASLPGNRELAKLAFTDLPRSLQPAIEHDFGRLAIGFGSSLKVWSDFYAIEDDLPVAVYVDPRRGHGLTVNARKFVFSAMYHHIARGDFSDVKLKIFTFPVNKEEKTRTVRVFDAAADDIIDYDRLSEKINETYQIWFSVLEEREAATKGSKKTGTDGEGFGF